MRPYKRIQPELVYHKVRHISALNIVTKVLIYIAKTKNILQNNIIKITIMIIIITIICKLKFKKVKNT
jgi:hypothetical protein